MNSTHILDALTGIDSSYILSAQKKLGYDENPRPQAVPFPRRSRTLRKTLALIAAVIMLVSICFTTAMAVSPEFRELVFTFFRIEQAESIPSSDIVTEITPENMTVQGTEIDIGGVIEGTYVRTPEASLARNGIFLICTDEVMMNSGNHYDAYIEENGQLLQLEEHLFSQDYQILGSDIHVEFEWVEHNGNVSFTYVDPDAAFRKSNLAGDVTATLFTLELDLPGDLGNTGYPVLINVETGELTDICAGTGVEDLPGLYQAAISEDLSKLLLVDWDNHIYYVDLAAKQLYSADALSGEHAEECVLTGSTLTCFALEGDSITEAKLGTYRAWAIDLATMERRELFTDIPATAATSYDVWSEIYSVYSAHLQSPESLDEIREKFELETLTCGGLLFIDGFNQTSHWGNMYAGSKFAVEVDLGRNVYVIDLSNGEKTLVDGFLWPELVYPDIQCVPSADGEKLLVYTSTTDGYFGSIGILDFSKKGYTEFSRENLGSVNEHTIYWFDNDSIAIAARAGGLCSEYYIYRLLD